MKGLVINADRTIEWIDVPEPQLKPGHVILNVAGCGICGSDMHVVRGAQSTWRFPILFGHEFAGTIAAMADDVTGFQVGDTVTVETMTYCGKCEMCKQGRYNLCPNAELYGAELPGGFAARVSVDARYLIRVPKGVSALEAAISEPLATVIHGFNRLRQKTFQNVVIFGAGAIGLLAASIAISRAENVAVVDVVPGRLQTAKEIGATLTVDSRSADVEAAVMEMTGGKKVDLCVDCAGISAVREQAFCVISPGAELLFIAMGHDVTEVNFRQLVSRELTAYGCQCHYMSDFEQALEALRDGVVKFDKLVTTYPLSEGREIFGAIRGGEDKGIKVVLVPGKGV